MSIITYTYFMCGILLSIRPLPAAAHSIKNHPSRAPFEEIWDNLAAECVYRGPDASKTVIKLIASKGAGYDVEIRIFASELQLSGSSKVIQPHVWNDDVFCWNGEVFEGLNLRPSDNDGAALFEKLRDLKVQDVSAELLNRIEGPYAFTYYKASQKRIIFGRDPLGRKSLLLHKPTSQNPYMLLASVSAGITERYLFEEVPPKMTYCIDIEEIHTSSIVGLRPSVLSSSLAILVNKSFVDFPSFTSYPEVIPSEFALIVDEFVFHLSRSVFWRVHNIPDPRTKGQARVAVLFSGGIDSSMIAYIADRYVPQDEPIDLLNVAFENPRKALSKNSLASHCAKMDPPQYIVPDRVTGLAELMELKHMCPHRKWNFVEIDIDFKTSSEARERVAGLMHPGRTVMDMSLALPLYFASKGSGQLKESDGYSVDYTSPAKVLLSGLGSDELLGGYARHRSVYLSGGWSAIIDELQAELDRIPSRNLGRDDRIISSHGKEARYPFLSLSVVNYVAGLTVNYKLDPRLEIGVGDKMLLRLAAAREGLVGASTRKKRAMQFGTHSAKMEVGDKGKRGDQLYNE